MRRERARGKERGESDGEKSNEEIGVSIDDYADDFFFFRAPLVRPSVPRAEKPHSFQSVAFPIFPVHAEERNETEIVGDEREENRPPRPAAAYFDLALSLSSPLLLPPIQLTASSSSTPRASPWIPSILSRPSRRGNRSPGRRRRGRAGARRPRARRRRGCPRLPAPAGSCSCRWPRPARGLLPCVAWWRLPTRDREGGAGRRRKKFKKGEREFFFLSL